MVVTVKYGNNHLTLVNYYEPMVIMLVMKVISYESIVMEFGNLSGTTLPRQIAQTQYYIS